MERIPITEKHNSGSNRSSPQIGRGLSGRRTVKLMTDKKIADDEFMAAALGDTEWLRQSLKGSRGAINYDKNGLAAIHLAAIHGRLDSMKLLIEKLKVDVNLASLTGWRPIHLVISNQTGKRAYSCLQYLLDKGADPSICNDDGITPVHQAASEGHVQCLKTLIEAGAVIDQADNRGHKPIDLAKIWGHKKCARILAAETWHREKDFVAKEMKQLDKLKMQQTSKKEEQNQAYQDFYGELAFKQWLESKNITPKNTEKNSQKNKDATPGKSLQNSSQKSQNTALAKPNSKRPQSVPVIKEETVKPKGRPMDTFPQKTYTGIPERPQTTESHSPPHQSELQDTEKQDRPIHSSPRWNKSTKLATKEYVTNLTDYYPRDEYTMLPKYPLKKGREDMSLSSTQITTKLPKNVIERALSAPNKRPVLYKPIAIMDVHKRKHYNEDEIPQKSEAGLHLTNDLTSRLFKCSLVGRNMKADTSKCSKVSDDTQSSSVITEADFDSLIKLMKRMASSQT